MSVKKLKSIDSPENQLRRAVCLKNTVLHMQAEVKEAKRIRAITSLKSSRRRNRSDMIDSPPKKRCLFDDDFSAPQTEQSYEAHDDIRVPVNYFNVSPVLLPHLDDENSMYSDITVCDENSEKCNQTEQSMDTTDTSSGCNSTENKMPHQLQSDTLAQSCALQVQEGYDVDVFNSLVAILSEC